MAKNVFNHQMGSEELAARPEPAGIPKMKTNVWKKEAGGGKTEHQIRT